MKKHRTWLFAPGSNARVMEKATKLDADVIIYDLEDAVRLEEKEQARERVEQHLQQNHGNESPYKVLRVNESNSPFFLEDVKAGVRAGVDGLILPKSENHSDMKIVDERIASIEQEEGLETGSVDLYPLIETARGVHNSYELASACSRIKRLFFGAVDYTVDIQTTFSEHGLELRYAQSQLVNSSYAAGIEGPIDTVYTDIQNERGLKKGTEIGQQLGFKGKMVIHPKQIEIVNYIYTPSEYEVQEATEIVNAYEHAKEQGKGAIQLHGKMIDLPVVESAERTLALIKMLKKTKM
ncbi:HpcH/HpaI aldolase/citrate lyase family protein [Shouchella shacheensis]|uniref:HpcH/HpaI aldolase/citrate lyase family protein n=1 Tax=Shouchella shacheensis TaxID=1649580 RepID=UPI0015D5E32C|nr:CoA ester lyase [Shouchella shacheensis]